MQGWLFLAAFMHILFIVTVS